MIVDAKTGRPNPAHSAQVMIYQYAVPKALEQYRGIEFRGHVIYPDGKNVGIPASGVDRKFIDWLGSLIRRLADENPARRVPSASECRWCDIALRRTARKGWRRGKRQKEGPRIFERWGCQCRGRPSRHGGCSNSQSLSPRRL